MQLVVEPDLGLCDNLKPNRFFRTERKRFYGVLLTQGPLFLPKAAIQKMDILQQSALAWKELTEYRYQFVLRVGAEFTGSQASPKERQGDKRADFAPTRAPNRRPKVAPVKGFYRHYRVAFLRRASPTLVRALNPRPAVSNDARQVAKRSATVGNAPFSPNILPYFPKTCRLSTNAQRRLRVNVNGRVIPSPVGPAIE